MASGPHPDYSGSWAEKTNANSYADDKMKFGYVEAGHTYDKDVNNYNFAKIEDYLKPLFTQKGNGAGGEQAATEIKDQLLNLIYPVGSIYTSVKNISPGTFLGGTWESLSGCMLYANTSGVNDSKYIKDAGNETITLSESQLPAHIHKIQSHSHGADGGTRTFLTMKDGKMSSTTGGHSGTGYSSWSYFWSSDTKNLHCKSATDSVSLETYTTGSGAAINIMPPYKNVYMWVRTA